jgi:hypothetical protein
MAMIAGPLFGRSETKLVVGTPAGKLHIFGSSDGRLKEETTLETQGGAVTALAIDEMMLGTRNLIAGDADGSVFIFSNREIIYRTKHIASISCLEIKRDLEDNCHVVAGDDLGALSCFEPHLHHWTLRLPDFPLPGTAFSAAYPSVRALLSVRLLDADGLLCHCVLVSDDRRALQLFNDPSYRSLAIPVPSGIATMCQGNFLRNVGDPSDAQVLLGCDDGNIYMLRRFQISKFARAGAPVSKLLPLPGRNFQRATSQAAVDGVVCLSESQVVQIFLEGQVAASIRSPSWILDVAVGDVDQDGLDEILLATVDQEVLVYKLGASQVPANPMAT